MQDYLIECRRLRKENESLRMRIAELESAQQWHPASEPPETVKREPCPPNAPPCEGNPAVCPWCREAHNDHA